MPDWEGPRAPKKPKPPRRGSGGNPDGAMLLVAVGFLAVPALLVFAAVLGLVLLSGCEDKGEPRCVDDKNRHTSCPTEWR